MKYLVIYGGAGVIGLICAMVLNPISPILGLAAAAVLGGAWGYGVNVIMSNRHD